MERTIDVTAARRQLGTILDEVFHKKEIITIQRKGKALARIVPLEHAHSRSNGLSASQQALLEEMEGLPVVPIDHDPTDLLRDIRKEKRAKAGKANAV